MGSNRKRHTFDFDIASMYGHYYNPCSEIYLPQKPWHGMKMIDREDLLLRHFKFPSTKLDFRNLEWAIGPRYAHMLSMQFDILDWCKDTGAKFFAGDTYIKVVFKDNEHKMAFFLRFPIQNFVKKDDEK